MKKIIFSLQTILMLAMVSTIAVSCSNDVPNPSIDITKETDNGLVLTVNNRKIIDTSWRLEKTIHYKYNNTASTSYKYNGVIKFSKDLYSYQVKLSNDYSYTVTKMKMYLDDVHIGYWEYNNEGLSMEFNDEWEEKNESFAYGAYYMSVKLNKNLLELTKSFPEVNERYVWTYNLVYRGDYNKSVNNDNEDEIGGSNSSYEKPEIGFDSYSATKTSLTVKFRIFNKDKAGITSSTIYYGKTSNPSQSVSTSISGVFVTATISGLSKGTEYWVKCKVTGKGGSTASDVVKCITNY